MEGLEVREWQQRLHAVMIEVRRDIYTDEATGAKTAACERIEQLESAVRAALQILHGSGCTERRCRAKQGNGVEDLSRLPCEER